MKTTRRVTKKRLEPILNAGADEARRIVHATVEDYFGAKSEDKPPKDKDILSDLEGSLGDAFETWGSARSGSAEERAALLRVVARAIVVLAVDECIRGSQACIRIEKRMDDLGIIRASGASSARRPRTASAGRAARR